MEEGEKRERGRGGEIKVLPSHAWLAITSPTAKRVWYQKPQDAGTTVYTYCTQIET